MAININIHFTGLCAFVPRSTGEITVLLPDARNKDGSKTSPCNENLRLRPHFPELLYFDPEQGRPRTWFPYRRNLKLELGELLSTPVKLPTAFESHIIKMADVGEGYGELEDTAVDGENSAVFARLQLAGGELKATNIVVDEFERPIQWSIGERQTSPLARHLIYTVILPHADHLEISATSFANAPRRGLNIFPPTDSTVINAIVRNDCACEQTNAPTDDSFLWFYTLCKNPLTENGCPIPTRPSTQPPPGDSDTFCPGTRFDLVE